MNLISEDKLYNFLTHYVDNHCQTNIYISNIWTY